jgi:hypothetical protein
MLIIYMTQINFRAAFFITNKILTTIPLLEDFDENCMR